MIRLVQPSMEYDQQIQLVRAELLRDTDEPAAFAGTGMLNICERTEDWLNSLKPKQHQPPATTYLAVDDTNTVLGIAELRHNIDQEVYSTYGGHIDMTIRPAKRGNGYGTEFFKLLLVEAAKLGLEEVLVTFLRYNACMTRIAVSCGGKYDGVVFSNKKPLLRYIIKVR